MTSLLEDELAETLRQGTTGEGTETMTMVHLAVKRRVG